MSSKPRKPTKSKAESRLWRGRIRDGAIFPVAPIAKQPVSQLPWGQIIRLLQMVKGPAARDFYIRETLTHGWSRAILELQIQNQLHLRAGKAQNNFAHPMPPAESVDSLAATSRKHAASGLQSGRGFVLPNAHEQVHEKTDLELVTWLVIKQD